MSFDYEIIRSRRKTIAIQIRPDCRIVVRAPLRLAKRDIIKFVEDKSVVLKDAPAGGHPQQRRDRGTGREGVKVYSTACQGICGEDRCKLWARDYQESEDQMGQLLVEGQSEL